MSLLKSPADFLAQAAIRSRRDAMIQVFETEPVAEVESPFHEMQVLADLELLLFSPNSKQSAHQKKDSQQNYTAHTCYWVSHGLTKAALRPPQKEKIVDDRFAGLGIEICLGFHVDAVEEHAKFQSAANHFASLIFEVAEALVSEPPFRTLLPGDILQTDEDDMHAQAPFSWLVLEARPFRNRLVLPTGHCHLVQLIPFFEEEVDATAHLAGEQRAHLVELLDVERIATKKRDSMLKNETFKSALQEVEDFK